MSFDPENCILAVGGLPYLIEDCKTCDNYDKCIEKKRIIRQVIFKDGKFIEQHIAGKVIGTNVDRAIEKFIMRVGFEDACVELLKLFGRSDVPIQILLEMNDDNDISIPDLELDVKSNTVRKYMRKLDALQLVTFVGRSGERGRKGYKCYWRLNYE